MIVPACSAGPVSFSCQKETGERKRPIGEGYKQSRPPLCTPPPESESLGARLVCLHSAYWLSRCQSTKSSLPCNGLDRAVGNRPYELVRTSMLVCRERAGRKRCRRQSKRLQRLGRNLVLHKQSAGQSLSSNPDIDRSGAGSCGMVGSLKSIGTVLPSRHCAGIDMIGFALDLGG